MSTTVSALYHLVYASNPEVTCPAQNLYGSSEYLLDGNELITRMELPIVDRIVAVIGPVVCQISGCDYKCRDAYLAIEDVQSIAKLEAIGFQYAEVPVRIKSLEEKRNSTITQISKSMIKPVFDEHNAQGFLGWDERCRNKIVDDLIDMHRGLFPSTMEDPSEDTPTEDK